MQTQMPPLPPVPFWGRVTEEPAWPFYDGFPRQYRVNQATGKFMLGTADLGAELELIIFDHRWDAGDMGKGTERWGYGLQVWLDAAFVDADGVVSVLSLKKDSAVNLHVRLGEIYKAGTVPHCYRQRLELMEIPAEGSSYYVAQIASTTLINEQEWQAMKRFVEADEFEWRLIGEITKGPHDDLPDGSDY